MLWWLYNLLFSVGFALLLPHYFLRMKRRGGYARHFGQRLGRYTPAVREALGGGGHVWLHAVSVGELMVAFSVIAAWRRRRPGVRFVVTTTTSTGYALAEKRIAAPDLLLYFPVDFPWVTRRALGQIKPRAIVLVECELWPNLIRLARRRGVPVALINGRISAHSYGGYRKLQLFTRPLLKMVAWLCAQGEEDRQRLIDLGADPARTRVTGSAKYDLPPPDPIREQQAREVLAACGMNGDTLLLLGGSTWAGEEGLLLDAYQALRAAHPNLALALVPRHFERCPAVRAEIEQRGLRVACRSEWRPGAPPWTPRPEVLLVDTTGELRSFYAAATVIFVGKSLTQQGGQNIIEPAACGKPVVVGPHMENFAGIAADFRTARALVQVNRPDELTAALAELLRHPELRDDYGRNAARLVREKSGAVERTLDLLLPVVEGGADARREVGAS